MHDAHMHPNLDWYRTRLPGLIDVLGGHLGQHGQVLLDVHALLFD